MKSPPSNFTGSSNFRWWGWYFGVCHPKQHLNFEFQVKHSEFKATITRKIRACNLSSLVYTETKPQQVAVVVQTGHTGLWLQLTDGRVSHYTTVFCSGIKLAILIWANETDLSKGTLFNDWSQIFLYMQHCFCFIILQRCTTLLKCCWLVSLSSSYFISGNLNVGAHVTLPISLR